MKRVLVAATATALIATGTVAAVATTSGSDWHGLRVGVGVADATWHVGAGAGQYASDADPTDLSSEWDPNVQHVKQASSYGVASRLSIRAIVLQDGAGDPPVALVKDDNYLAQDMLTRRVAQILAADGSKVTYDHLLLSATHDHNSPYYSTPAAGVWLFQDVMDLRMFEYQARQMASAIEQAERSMVPARVGATTVQFPDFQGNIAGQDLDAQGAPAGYPEGDNDHGLVVMRFDDMSDPSSPKPLATYVNYAEHGESLDGYDLISGDWLAPFQRYVDRATGVPVVFSQGSVGSAEGPYDRYGSAAKTPKADDHGDQVLEIWGHMGYAQAERGTHLLAEQVIAAWNAIGGANNGITVQVPYQSDPPVTMLTHWVAGPLSHPYPSVGNCRTGPTVGGDPGLPAAGLPDCARSGDNLGFTLPLSPTLFDQLKAAGAPIPDNYDATSFGSVEENLRLKLQAVRIGGVLLASCACEPQSDLIKNLESRTDDDTATRYDGFDYGNQADVDEGWPGRGTKACFAVDDGANYDCPDPRDWLFGQKRITVSKAAYDHMEAELHNDAAGWDDPSYAVQAGSEPTALADIKGNFTHTQLGAGAYAHCPGYALPVGLGHTGDYNGYTVTYREYEARDAYRKALTSYGPHTADYMVTNLLAMAANLKCGTPLPNLPTDPIAQVDEQRQAAEAAVLGQLSSAYYDGWSQQIPDSAGPARPLEQPRDIERFDATQFRWVGGDNWTDDPTVVVQRQVEGNWRFYADQSGEVQVFLDTPTSDAVTGTPTYRSGAQEWHWRASFEAFDSYPRADVDGGQVPNGTYRFVADGHIHTGGAVAPYHLASAPFTVSPWTGITARDLRRNGQQVSFVIDPISYPRLPSKAGRAGIRWYADDGGGTPGHGLLCKTCSFRPWATTGRVVSAVVQVRRGNSGQVETVPAHFDAASGRWLATVPSGDGLRISVPAGGIRDSYGETNGTALS
ncbi:MAG TPA: hypothetical protein VFT62_02590 [Mycobacteriales bacterium]|nr:hypothetical protein [Mycobacteriales bacterium]